MSACLDDHRPRLVGFWREARPPMLTVPQERCSWPLPPRSAQWLLRGTLSSDHSPRRHSRSTVYTALLLFNAECVYTLVFYRKKEVSPLFHYSGQGSGYTQIAKQRRDIDAQRCIALVYRRALVYMKEAAKHHLQSSYLRVLELYSARKHWRRVNDHSSCLGSSRQSKHT